MHDGSFASSSFSSELVKKNEAHYDVLPNTFGPKSILSSGKFSDGRRKFVATHREVLDRRMRGWVEPGPDNLRRRLAPSALADAGIHVLRWIMSFCDADTLDNAAALVNSTWHYCVHTDQELSRRRCSFRFQALDDGKGILYYLACSKQRPPPSEVELSMTPNAFNASVGPLAKVKLASICVDNEHLPVPYSTVSFDDGKHIRVNPGLSRAPILLSNLVAFKGTGYYATPNIPTPWAGVDFQSFAVTVSAYSFHIAASSPARDQGRGPVPLSWELQGCISPENEQQERDWGACRWHTLDRRVRAELVFGVDSASNQRRDAAVFFIGDGDPKKQLSLRYAPMRRLRIVALSRNSQCGWEMPICGLEFYGDLVRRVKL
jgi:hypothetical protein